MTLRVSQRHGRSAKSAYPRRRRAQHVALSGASRSLVSGRGSYEGRAGKFYGCSWSTDIEEADSFARHYQTASGGSIVLETLASPDAIISAPCLTGPSWESTDGSPLYDRLIGALSEAPTTYLSRP
jgi:hypothetical protein